MTTTVTEDDILGTWAGLRPLVAAAASERTADLSRRHSVHASASGVVTVTGGKLTTYRRMAADAVDAVGEASSGAAAAAGPSASRCAAPTAGTRPASRGRSRERVRHRRAATVARARTHRRRSSRGRSSTGLAVLARRGRVRGAGRDGAHASTTCCRAAHAPGCWRATRRRGRGRRRRRAHGRASSGWADAERERQVARYRALDRGERARAAGSPKPRSTRCRSRPPIRSLRGRADRTGARRRRRSRSRRRGATTGSATTRVDGRRRAARAARATGADVSDAADDDRRGEPRLVAARDDLGARRAGRGARRGGRAARTTSREVPAVLARVQRGARPGHRGGGPQRRVRRERPGVRRRAARPHRARGHRRRRRRPRWSSTCCRARSATCSRTSCAPTTASRAGTGHSRWRCRRSAAGSPAAAPGQLSTRYGKIEDIVDGLDVVLADGTPDPHRWRAARRGRPRSQRSCSSARKARSA